MTWWSSLGSQVSSPESSPRSLLAELIREVGLAGSAVFAIFEIGRWVLAGKVEGLHGLVAVALIAAPGATIGAIALLLRSRQAPRRRRGTGAVPSWDDKTPTPKPLIFPPSAK